MYCPHKPIPSLRTGKAFRQVYQGGRYAASPFFVVYALPVEGQEVCLGLSVSKKVGNAVVRNKVKRWVKEYCRLHPPAGGFHYVVAARAAIAAAYCHVDFTQVAKALHALFARLERNERKAK
jgi:ribonuclease P protein component